MPTKLSTTIKKIELVQNPVNARLIFEFHKFMMSNGSSERHQNNKNGNYQTFNLAKRYDAFLHIDKTQAIHPLHMPELSEVPDLPETFPSGL